MSTTAQPTEETPRYMSVRDIASIYAVPTETVYAAIRRRELPAVRAFGVLRVPKSALRTIKLLEDDDADHN